MDLTLPSQIPPVIENTGAPSNTPDPCSPGNMADTLQPNLIMMQRFDDAATLVSNTPREQLVDPITNLQAVRRDALAEAVPDCLADLHLVRIAYMNQVIEVSMAFLNGSVTHEEINAGLEGSRQLRLLYEQELESLWGSTPAAEAPLEASPLAGTAPPEIFSTANDFPQVKVTSPDGVNVRSGPGGNFPITGNLQQGSTATALARSEDMQWLLIESPEVEGQGWVFAALVELNIPMDQLLIAPTPTP